MNKGLPFAIYLRKSTESGDRQTQSIESQLFDLRKYAKTNQLNVVKTVQEERSAKKPFNRPRFTELLNEIETGQIKGLLVWEASRISRNPTESGMVQQLLIDGKLQQIRTMTRVFEPEDNSLLFGVESAFSSQYSIDLKRRAIRGYRTKIRNGQLSGLAPEGYVNNKADQTTTKDELRFPIIRRAFDMYLNGSTVSEIKCMLDECGYLTIKRAHSGGRKIATSTIYKMLSNPRYAGRIPDPDEPDDMSKMHIAKYPHMITYEEFNKVQDILSRSGRSRYVTKKYFEMKGLLRCGECGCSITAERKVKAIKGGGMNYHVYYHCTHKRPCSQKAITEIELANQIDQLLNYYELPSSLYEWGEKTIRAIADKEIMQRDDTAAVELDNTDSLKAKLSKLLDHLTDDVISTEEYKSKSDPIKAELQQRQNAQLTTLDTKKHWYELVGRTLEYLHNCSKEFSHGDASLRKDILLSIGTNPILTDKKLSIQVHPWLKEFSNEMQQQKYELAKELTTTS